MMHLIDLLYVGLQCIGLVYKLLNPGQTSETVGIIHEILRIIVLVQRNMLEWLKTNLPGPPELEALMLLETVTYQSLLGA
jgi:hypothetical protein